MKKKKYFTSLFGNFIATFHLDRVKSKCVGAWGEEKEREMEKIGI